MTIIVVPGIRWHHRSRIRTPKLASKMLQQHPHCRFLSNVRRSSTTRTKRDGKQSTNTSTVADARSTPTQQEANAGSPSHYKPLSLSPRTAFHPFPTTKVAAAPPVPITTTTATDASSSNVRQTNIFRLGSTRRSRRKENMQNMFRRRRRN